MKKLLDLIRLLYIKNKWRIKNKENFTTIKNLIPLEILTVGKFSYGGLDIAYFGNKDEKLEIGSFVSIAPGVKFILGGNHEINKISTYPFKVKILDMKTEAWTKGKITVCDDVWIGMNSIILSGVKIGQGAIIAAGSVVTKDVPPYSIVGGNPATVIKYRFSKEIIKNIETIKWSKVDVEKIKNNIDFIYENITLENMESLKRELL